MLLLIIIVVSFSAIVLAQPAGTVFSCKERHHVTGVSAALGNHSDGRTVVTALVFACSDNSTSPVFGNECCGSAAAERRHAVWN